MVKTGSAILSDNENWNDSIQFNSKEYDTKPHISINWSASDCMSWQGLHLWNAPPFIFNSYMPVRPIELHSFNSFRNVIIVWIYCAQYMNQTILYWGIAWITLNKKQDFIICFPPKKAPTEHVNSDIFEQNPISKAHQITNLFVTFFCGLDWYIPVGDRKHFAHVFGLSASNLPNIHKFTRANWAWCRR